MTANNRKMISKEEAFERMEGNNYRPNYNSHGPSIRKQLIRNGIIRPYYRLQPQMMVKDSDGRWCPELEIHQLYNPCL